MNISETDKIQYLERFTKAANWFANSQLIDVHYKNAWNSERGRFMYQYHMPSKQYVPGINWTQGRGLFVLTEAMKLANTPELTEAAYRAYRFVSALQITDPYYAQVHGAIKECASQGSLCGTLDGAQAASGLLLYAHVTGDPDAQRRGQAFCDFLLRNFDDNLGCPASAELYPEPSVESFSGYGQNAIGQCAAIPCWHLYCTTGDKKYLKPILWGADYVLECQRADGALHNVKDISKVEPATPDHHEGRGEGDERYVLHNDDGIATLMLSAYLATKDKKYLDCMVGYADWITTQPVEERPYCAFPVRANTLLDVGKFTGKDYSPWVLDHLDKHLLQLQVLDSDDPNAQGGFLGEDEQDEGGVFGGTSLEYVTTRMTCYAAGTLLRLSGKGLGFGFSPLSIPHSK